jgi:NAD(P)-dependent dehydrogenase (short-subunit alcohol dehydrogenase family)
MATIPDPSPQEPEIPVPDPDDHPERDEPIEPEAYRPATLVKRFQGNEGQTPMRAIIGGPLVHPSAKAIELPRGEYPAPPFVPQQQPWPGMAVNMNPRPDHGEQTYRGAGRLTGRRALITGGDSGMGAAAAIAFAREGAAVVISYLPEEQADADLVLKQIHAAGVPGFGIAGDLRDEAFCQGLVAQAVEAMGGLDLLVSNAGRQQSVASIVDLTSEEFDATMKTNIYAPFWLIRAAVPHMQPGSVIIGTTSEQAEDPTPDIYHYAMTKAATSNYVRGLGKQLAPRGIRVCGVAPGPIWTPLQVSGGASIDNLVGFGGQTPLGRPGQPAELAGIYVLLADSASSFTTGAVYGASGGAGKP